MKNAANSNVGTKRFVADVRKNEATRQIGDAPTKKRHYRARARKCANCHVSFKPKKSCARTCSKRCRQQLYLLRLKRKQVAMLKTQVA